MEYAYSVVLGLVITVSLAGAAIAYIGEYAQNTDDQYQVIAHADIISSNGSGADGSNNAPGFQVIVITYTNAGNLPLLFFEASVTECASCHHTKSETVQAHTSRTVSWIVKNEVLRDKIIEMHFTFEDATVVLKTQRLR